MFSETKVILKRSSHAVARISYESTLYCVPSYLRGTRDRLCCKRVKARYLSSGLGLPAYISKHTQARRVLLQGYKVQTRAF